MDPRLEANPPEEQVAAALAMWPELAGKRTRPLFVSAFGDIYVELENGEVHVASPLELTSGRIAASTKELEALFSNTAWAQDRLITELVLLASERGIKREPYQVFAVAPHPSLSGHLRVEGLMVMDLKVWHTLSTQLRGGEPTEAPTTKKQSWLSRFMGPSK